MKEKYDKFMEDMNLREEAWAYEKASDKVRKGAGEVVTLDPAEAAQYIVDKFKEKHVI